MSTTDVRTRHSQSPKYSAARNDRSVRTGLVLVVLFLALATAGVTAIAFWGDGAPPAAPTTPPRSRVVAPPPAYLPGGSVYEEQVPDHIEWSIASGAAAVGRVYQIDELVAMQKERMARDYVTYAAARARLAAHTGSGLGPDAPRTNRWGLGGSDL